MAREETELSFSSDSHYPAGGRPGSNMDTLTEEETEDGGGYSDSNSKTAAFLLPIIHRFVSAGIKHRLADFYL